MCTDLGKCNWKNISENFLRKKTEMSITSRYINREHYGGSSWNINFGKNNENYFWKIIFEPNYKARERTQW